MSTPGCTAWRGLLAADAAGGGTPEEEGALRAHLAGCPACRQDRAELAEVVVALRTVAGADRPAATEPRPGERPSSGTVRHRTGRPGRARRVLVAAAGAVAVLSAVAAGAAATGGAPAAPGHRTARLVELEGTAGAHGTARLVPEGWGTRVELVEAGGPPGAVLTVSMATGAGYRWAVGTFRVPTGGRATVQLACAARPGAVTALWITDRAGDEILWGRPS